MILKSLVMKSSLTIPDRPETKPAPRESAGPAALPMLDKALLACGILAALTYVAANIVGAGVWPGYSLADHTVSELSAVDAPSRPLMIAFMTAYSLLTIAFGLGVWRIAGQNRTLRILAALLIGYGAVCLTGPLTPMHRREVLAAGGGTLSDQLHIAMTIVDVLFIVLIIGFGAAAFGRRFRWYSIATIVVLMAFGAWTSLDAPGLEGNLPTPWMGLKERINIGVFLVWSMALAIRLWLGQSRR
jgi:hypothetical protein